MGIILLVLFSLGLVGWLRALPETVSLFREICRIGHAGRDTAMAVGIWGAIMAGVSFVLLLPTVICSLLARHFPLAWRIVALLPSCTGLLVGAAFLYWAEFCR